MAWSDMSEYEEDRRFWIQFVGIKNFKVDGAGKGTIDGNGKIWWQHSCKTNPNLVRHFQNFLFHIKLEINIYPILTYFYFLFLC